MLNLGKGRLPVRPYGMTLEGSVVQVEAENLRIEHANWVLSDQIRFEGTIRGRTVKGPVDKTIVLSLPTIDSKGFYTIGPTKFVVCIVGKKDAWNPVSKGWYFLSKGQVLIRILEEALSKALAPLYFQLDLNTTQLDATIQSALVNHPWVRQVPMGKESVFADTVLLDFGVKTLHPSEYEFPEELVGSLDPASTSAGDRINQVYQLCRDARVVNGKIVKGESDTCEFVESFAISPQYSPRRKYLLRAAGLNSLDLMNPDPDLFGRETSVQSKVLTTAVIDMGVFTFEDAIAVRKDLDFDATELTRITAWSEQPFTIRVHPGSMIKEGDTILETPKGFFASSIFLDLPSVIKAPSFAHPTVLDHVDVMTGWFLGQKMYRSIVYFRSFMQLQEGDKLTNLSGAKGVCLQVDDMPVDEHGNTVDICVSATGVARRGATQILYEMMLRHSLNHGGSGKDSFKEMVLNSGFTKTTLTWRGKKISAAVGDVAWVRLNKLSAKIACGIGEDRPTQPDGLPIDQASLAGQMLDVSKSTILYNLGMMEVLSDCLKDQAGVKRFREIVMAIESPADAHSKQKNTKQASDKVLTNDTNTTSP